VLIGWIGLLALVAQSDPKQAASPLSVADAINESANYADRSVTITGSLFITIEVTALKGVGCIERMSALRRPFACAVSLILPDCKTAAANCGQGLLDVISEVRGIRLSREDSVVRVVLTGRLAVAPTVFREFFPSVPGLPIPGPRGEYVQMGFGHMGAFPVRLTVTDGRVLPAEKAGRH
jgi:hypothetical protein